MCAQQNFLAVDILCSLTDVLLITLRAVWEINEIVLSCFCLQPQRLVVKRLLTGYTSSLVAF